MTRMEPGSPMLPRAVAGARLVGLLRYLQCHLLSAMPLLPLPITRGLEEHCNISQSVALDLISLEHMHTLVQEELQVEATYAQ